MESNYEKIIQISVIPATANFLPVVLGLSDEGKVYELSSKKWKRYDLPEIN